MNGLDRTAKAHATQHDNLNELVERDGAPHEVTMPGAESAGSPDTAARTRPATTESDPAPDQTASPKSRVAALRELTERANRGSEHALVCLRQLLNDCPEIWQQAGDLTRIVEMEWISLIAGKDHLTTEAIKRQVAVLKDELKGPHATAMEALLADQVALTWLATRHAEFHADSPAGTSLDQASYKLKRVESAQKRFLNAAKMLVSLRTAMPSCLVPVNHLQAFSPKQKQKQA